MFDFQPLLTLPAGLFKLILAVQCAPENAFNLPQIRLEYGCALVRPEVLPLGIHPDRNMSRMTGIDYFPD